MSTARPATTEGGMMGSTIHAITIDCANAERLADFWAAALDYERRPPSGEFRVLADPSGRGPRLLFQQVPEPKAVKNRVHLDLGPHDEVVEVERLVRLGATRVEKVERDGGGWTVMRDPEGNEFCV
jgi:hypothetical protein